MLAFLRVESTTIALIRWDVININAKYLDYYKLRFTNNYREKTRY